MTQDNAGRADAADRWEVQPDTEPGLDFGVYFRAIKRRRRILLGVLVIFVVLGLVSAVARPPLYESTAKLVVTTQRTSGLPALDASIAREFQNLLASRSIETQVEIISDRRVLQEAFTGLDESARKNAFGVADDIPEWAVEVSTVKATQIIEITAKSYDPETSAKLADNVAQVYFKQDIEEQKRSVRQARQYAEDKMKATEDDLSAANEELAEFKSANRLFSPDVQVSKVAEYLARLEFELESGRADLSGIDSEMSKIESELAAEEPDVVTSKVVKRNPQFAAAVERIDRLYSEKAALLQEYTAESDEVKAIENRIGDEEKRLKDITQTLLDSEVTARNPIRDTLRTNYAIGLARQASARARVDSIAQEVEVQWAQANELPELQRRLTELMQRVSTLTKTYSVVSEQYYSLLLREEGVQPTGDFVSRADTDEGSALFKRGRTFFTFLVLGAFLALAAALAVDYVDPRVRSRDAAEQTTGIPVLASIPQASKGASVLIGEIGADSPVLEGFRVLRNSIYLATADGGRILGVTGSSGSEGKSVVSANLAAALAMDRKRVMLVDCNLRRPTLHTLMKTSCNVGLTSVLTGACELEKAITATDQENLDLLPTGPLVNNSPELLNSPDSRKVFERLAASYDFVIVDCPSLANLSDIQAIAKLVGGMLVVANAQRTQRSQLRDTARSLVQADARTIGVILNQMQLDAEA